MRKRRSTGFVMQAARTLLGWWLRDTAFEFILDLFDDNNLGQ